MDTKDYSANAMMAAVDIMMKIKLLQIIIGYI